MPRKFGRYKTMTLKNMQLAIHEGDSTAVLFSERRQSVYSFRRHPNASLRHRRGEEFRIKNILPLSELLERPRPHQELYPVPHRRLSATHLLHTRPLPAAIQNAPHRPGVDHPPDHAMVLFKQLGVLPDAVGFILLHSTTARFGFFSGSGFGLHPDT